MSMSGRFYQGVDAVYQPTARAYDMGRQGAMKVHKNRKSMYLVVLFLLFAGAYNYVRTGKLKKDNSPQALFLKGTLIFMGVMLFITPLTMILNGRKRQLYAAHMMKMYTSRGKQQ